MPTGMVRGEYDTLCPKEWMRQYSRVLRSFIVPVATELKPLRGIQVATPGAPNPASQLGPCDNNPVSQAFVGQEIGLPTSVLSLYYFDLENQGANTTDSPSTMILEIRQGASFALTSRYIGNFTPNSFSERDLLIQVSGLLGVQWEIWGRIDQGGFPVRVSLAACLSEHDDKHNGIYAGPSFPAKGP